uniref:50S ribosomal protein L22 n=1 Tax=Lygus hesperus TaxID=30085 RepID=A0A0A9YN01_LYGHE
MLTLLLEHARRIITGQYSTGEDDQSQSDNSRSVTDYNSNQFVELKMKSVWTTLRELYGAEPVVVAVCDSFLLDTSNDIDIDRNDMVSVDSVASNNSRGSAATL